MQFLAQTFLLAFFFTSKNYLPCSRTETKGDTEDGCFTAPCHSTSEAGPPTPVVGQTGTHSQLVGEL